MSRFQECLAITLVHEGGWADHPSDPGGATMKGVTIAVYRNYKGREVTKNELRNIPDNELEDIYRKGYWDKVKADQLPAGLDLVAFDAAVNSGPVRSVKWLQIGLGVTPDGAIGPNTLRAANACNVHAAIDLCLDARLNFLKNLRTWPVFGRGWARRVEEVRQQAHARVGASEPVRQTNTPSLFSIITNILRGTK